MPLQDPVGSRQGDLSDAHHRHCRSGEVQLHEEPVHQGGGWIPLCVRCQQPGEFGQVYRVEGADSEVEGEGEGESVETSSQVEML